ncbi:MAG: hypothetical protein EXS18_01540 [Verrucomicrobiae bacterium]|nr:hypothetical protein [Verrucomicrobiae bacterium]
MNRSSVRRLSVSVGSILIDSRTLSGKQTVGAWKPKSKMRLSIFLAASVWTLVSSVAMIRKTRKHS